MSAPSRRRTLLRMRSARNSITHGSSAIFRALGLLLQNGDTRLDVRRLQLRSHAPFEARDEPLLELLDLAGRTIARKHDLLVTVVQGVEGVEELLLRTLLAREKLDVVDHQDIRVAVFLAELDQRAVLNGIDELVGELLAGKIDDARGLLVVDDEVADGLQEVRFSQSAPSVHEKGVVGLGGRLGHRNGGSVRELVVRPDHERFETCCGDSFRRWSDSGRARKPWHVPARAPRGRPQRKMPIRRHLRSRER